MRKITFIAISLLSFLVFGFLAGIPNPVPSPKTASIRSSAVPLAYLLEEDFETVLLQGWDIGPTIAVTQSDSHNGSHSLEVKNGSTQVQVATQPGTEYKITAWIRITAQTGEDWGGFRLEAQDWDFNSLAHSGWILTETHGNQWRKIALTFTAVTHQTRILSGYFGGPERELTALLDDVKIFQKGQNRPPEIQVSVSPIELDRLPSEISYQFNGDDPDGALVGVVWDFGNGFRSFEQSGSQRITSAGDFNGTIRVEDDDGSVVIQEFNWKTTGPDLPFLTLAELPDETGLPEITVNGTASNGLRNIQVSTDRGELTEVSNEEHWTARIHLQPGWNRLLIQAADNQGHWITAERMVRYVPPGPLSITAVRGPRAPVECWQPFEITFQVNNSAATHTDFPFQKESYSALEDLDGISVDVLFSPDDWQTIYRRPAFLHRPYQFQEIDQKEWAVPEGTPVWMVRFSPPLEGRWKYRVEVEESKGVAASMVGSFNVTSPASSSHGPIQVSESDPRYFDYADGTPFIGSGYNLSFSSERYSYEAQQIFEEIEPGSASLFRWWIGGSLWGSAWQPWDSMTIGFNGYLPYTGQSLDRAYGSGLASIKLDAENPVMFQGWNSGHASLVQGQKYRLILRWRTEAIAGPAQAGLPYGLTVKFADWPQPGVTRSLPSLIPHEYGDSPWHISSTDFTAGTHFLPGLALVLENTTAGTGYIDEISVYPVEENGSLGSQVLRGSRTNTHLLFDPLRAAAMDRILNQAADHGLSFRLVIGEKDEWLLNHISPSGLPDPLGGNYFNGPGTFGGFLHAAYWRMLSARYGAYSSLHSWELVNEAPPSTGPHIDLAAAFSAYMAADGNPHPAGISTWATLAEDAWGSGSGKKINHIDFHRYAQPEDQPGWVEDSAAFFMENDQAVLKASFQRPVVWGELGVLENAGSSSELPDLAQETNGVWLHKIIWARTGPGGVYPIFWFSDKFFANDLHHIFTSWNRFMEGIPVNNGRYQDTDAQTSTPGLRVTGQKDLQSGRAHLWVDNPASTWQAVYNHEAVLTASGVVTLHMDRPGENFRITWVNTWTGEPTRVERLSAGPDGTIEIQVVDLGMDIGLKIELE